MNTASHVAFENKMRFVSHSNKVEIKRNWSVCDVPTVVTVGNFDGVHLGHRHLLSALASSAAEGLSPLVVTFEPHPLALLDPGRAPPKLLDLRAKAELLAAQGVARINVMAFNAKLASSTPAEFVDGLLNHLGMRKMVVGSDFRFGKKRAGNVEVLGEMARDKGFSLMVVDDSKDNGERVSSKLVRKAVCDADFDRASHLLGRRYKLAGRVVHGKGLGRKLGWPTANIRFGHRPALSGIYAAFADLDGKRWQAAVSVGTRPAAGGGELTVEAYLIGFGGDAYGMRLELEPVAKIRNEKDFANLDELRSAIAADVEQCSKLLSEQD